MTETEPAPTSPMHIDASRAKELSTNVSNILSRIHSAAASTKPSSHHPPQPVRLVAVSKLKPANDILALHLSPTHNHLHFGENYQQELLQKSLLLPRAICWHFIGALQTNKCRPLAEQIPNLWCVESVDTRRKAEGLDKGRRAMWEREANGESRGERRLRVFVQVNTSGEEGKSGCEPADAGGLCRYIRDECAGLILQGVMTIGAIARSQAAGKEEEEGGRQENEDFVKLREVRDSVAEELGVGREELELSMGMSEDFESAIRSGSNEVRVGSTIFGQRPAKQDAKIKEDVEEGGD